MLSFLKSLILRPLLTSMIALRALRRNKLRSILTALGIIIGVCSVVVMPIKQVSDRPAPHPCEASHGRDNED